MNDERYDFERWAYKKAESSNYRHMDYVLKRLVDSDDYATNWVDVAWMAWQARADEATKQQSELRDALKLCVKELQHRHTARVITSDEAETLRVGKSVLAKLESGGDV